MCSQAGEQALIIDAGGGTIDISTYTVLSNGPLQVEELYEPQCEFGPHSGNILPLDSIHFRRDPRRRARYSEGNSDGQRCLLTLHSLRPGPITQPATREVEVFQIQHPRGSGSIFPEVRRRAEESIFAFEQP